MDAQEVRVLHPSPAHLSAIFDAIEYHDEHYAVRYGLVLEAVALAHRLGYAAGFRLDPTEPEWPVAYIALPQGQVSWHMPQFSQEWDGHSNAEKYRRCRAFGDAD